MKKIITILLLLAFTNSYSQVKLFDVEFKDCKVYIKQTNSKESWSVKPVNGFWYDGNATIPTYNFATGNTNRSLFYNQFNSIKFNGATYTQTTAPLLADTIRNYLKYCIDSSALQKPDTTANAILRGIKDSIGITNNLLRDTLNVRAKIINDSLKVYGKVHIDTSINPTIRAIKTRIDDSLRTFQYSYLDSNRVSRKLVTITNDSTTLSRKEVQIIATDYDIEHIRLSPSDTDLNPSNTLRGIGITGTLDAIYEVNINGNTIAYSVADGLLFADYNVPNGTINHPIDITCIQGTIIVYKAK